MRFQLLIVGLATVLSFVFGIGRWRATIASARAFDRDETAGRWRIVVGDYEGIHTLTRSAGRSPVAGLSRLAANQAWNVTPDLARAAIVDNYSYSGNPGIKVYAANAPNPLAESAPPAGSAYYCPVFDLDGSLLFVEAVAQVGALRRLDVPRSPASAKGPSSIVTDVRTATPLRFDDCLELSGDGTRLAWLGSDLQVHVARRTPSGFLGDHRTFAGTEFAMSEDGATIAVRDGGGISIVEVASGARALLTSDTSYGTLLDFSPDGRWLAVIAVPSISSRGGITTLRVRDGAKVRMPATRSAFYFMQPGQIAGRWIATP